MMKKFLLKLSYTVFPVFLFLFGVVVYLSLYVTPKLAGDLGRLAYIPFGFEYDTMIDSRMMKELLFTTINQTEDLKNINADVLTVGDSFSQQGRGGYQNYLPGKGISVVNCNRELYENPLQYAYNLLDAGIIDSTNFKVMVVEIGERDIEYRFQTFDIAKKEKPAPPTDEGRSNSWSLLRARDYLMYNYGGKSPVYVADLNKDYFESSEPRKLYFYFNDITNGVSLSDASQTRIKDIYNLFLAKAEVRGLKIVLMVPVDKYDLYQKYIVDNPYPLKSYNEEIRSLLGDTPNVFLTKYCLTPLTDQGEKDVFIFTNTHWSYKAAEAVGIELSKRVKLLTNK